MTLELIPDAPVRSTGRRITDGKLTGQKSALKMKEVWSIRARLELRRRVRDLALFNLAIDSNLRACDLTSTMRGPPGPVDAFACDYLRRDV